MRLVDKLRKISAPSPDPVPALRLEARPALRSDALPGEEVEGELGAFWVRRTRLPASHRHGRWSVGDLRGTRLDLLAEVAREPRLKDVSLEDAVFFDTVFFLLIPLAIGLFIRARYEEAAGKIQPTFAMAANFGIILLAVLGLVLEWAIWCGKR